MEITFEIEFCKGACIHACDAHVFGENGILYACNHPDLDRPKHQDSMPRLLTSIEIPEWCPLRHGKKYQ